MAARNPNRGMLASDSLHPVNGHRREAEGDLSAAVLVAVDGLSARGMQRLECHGLDE